MELKFNNKKFKIMLVGDPHCNAKDQTAKDKAIIKDYLSLQYAALEREKPDLVILMGDNAGGENAEDIRKVLLRITKPYADNHIPFSFILGNHDLQSGVKTLNELYKIYKELPYCILPEECSSYGDYEIKVNNSDGTKTALSLFHMYSGDCAEDKYYSCYDYVKEEQINFIREKTERLTKENGKTPAVVFQHMPVLEEFGLLKQKSFLSMLFNGVYGINENYGKFYTLNSNAFGYLGECPCPPGVNGGEFEAVKNTGNIFAMFFGHDHMNDFVGMYDGIIMGQTKLSSFNAYGDGLMQGVRILEFDEDSPFTLKTKMLYYRDIFGNNCRSIKGSQKIFRDRTSVKLEASLKAAGILAAISLPIAMIKLLIK
ncbi:MAG: metallophosphoesterase [Oscillospiraceae bacterium]|nr:metallophosphoesterase [Oscillospiraceae bacterium]